MRTLERNKTTLWRVVCLGEGEIYDEDGYYTGEIGIIYGEPEEIKLMFQPVMGEVKDRVFGKSVDVEMMSTASLDLNYDDLIFLVEPDNDDYSNKYDYKITSKLPTLNSYIYGFKGRL